MGRIRRVLQIALVAAVVSAVTFPLPTFAFSCAGDCNGNAMVTVDELLTLVNIALGNADVSMCTSGDADGDHRITVNEILTAVNAALNGCKQQPPTQSPTPTLTPSPSPLIPTPTATLPSSQGALDFTPEPLGAFWFYTSISDQTVGGTSKRSTSTRRVAITGFLDGITTKEIASPAEGKITTRTVSSDVPYAGSMATVERKSYDGNGKLLSRMQFDPPSVSLPSDVTIGHVETRPSQVTLTVYDGSQPRTTPYSLTMTVVGYEDVTVPAGTFRDALKIRQEGPAPAGATIHPILGWYVRGVGLVKTLQEISQSGPGWSFYEVNTMSLTSYSIP